MKKRILIISLNSPYFPTPNAKMVSLQLIYCSFEAVHKPLQNFFYDYVDTLFKLFLAKFLKSSRVWRKMTGFQVRVIELRT